MSDHYWLTEAQIERQKPYFPRSHAVLRVDDRRVPSGIMPRFYSRIKATTPTGFMTA